MVLNEEFWTPGQILAEIPGLTRHKLMYWADQGYVRVKIRSINGRNYREFYSSDLLIIKRAYRKIVLEGLKDRIAFDKIKKEGGQLEIFDR